MVSESSPLGGKREAYRTQFNERARQLRPAIPLELLIEEINVHKDVRDRVFVDHWYVSASKEVLRNQTSSVTIEILGASKRDIVQSDLPRDSPQDTRPRPYMLYPCSRP